MEKAANEAARGESGKALGEEGKGSPGEIALSGEEFWRTGKLTMMY